MGSDQDDTIYTAIVRVDRGVWCARRTRAQGRLRGLAVYPVAENTDVLDVRFSQGARSAVAAEQRVRRRLEEIEVTVLGVRVEPTVGQREAAA